MRGRAWVGLIGLLLVTACSSQGSATNQATRSPSPPTSAAASVVVSAGPSEASALEGVWHTGVVTPDDATAALQAAGLGQYAQGFFDFWKIGQKNVFTLRVSGGRWSCYVSKDGGPKLEDDAGSYTISGNTVTIRHNTQGSDTHQWAVSGDTLTIRYLSDTFNDADLPVGEEVYQTVLYMSSTWTRGEA